MPDYRRYFVPGGTYFFTAVVNQRFPLFEIEDARAKLREAILKVKKDRPFELLAICLLPNHLHAVWTLPQGDSDYPTRWRLIKEEFTTTWLTGGGWEGELSESRKKKGERGIWQRRFWEHTIFDEDDLIRCIDYTHWNPRKHGLVKRVRDWKYSSFFRFVESGDYDIDWGGTDPCPGYDAPEWGE